MGFSELLDSWSSWSLKEAEWHRLSWAGSIEHFPFKPSNDLTGYLDQCRSWMTLLNFDKMLWCLFLSSAFKVSGSLKRELDTPCLREKGMAGGDLKIQNGCWPVAHHSF